MKSHKFVSAVFRLRNAESRVARFLQELDNYFNERFDAFEIIVVSDASSDRSSDVVKSVAPSLHGAVSMIELAHYHGVEAAIMAGLDRAMGDFVFEFEDTFLNFPLDVLDRMYETAVGGYDIVAAVPARLRWGENVFYGICNAFSSFEPPLTYERIRVSSRRALDGMLQQRERIRYRQVLYRFTGYRYTRVEYTPDRSSAHQPQTSLRFALDVIFSFTDAGVRIAHAFVLVFLAMAVIAIVIGIVGVASHTESAWELAITVVVVFGFSGLFLVLAVLGEYTARILAEVRSRPLYTLDKTLTWAITPTETSRVPHPIPSSEQVAVRSDREPFMLRQRKEAARDRKRTLPDENASSDPMNQT